MNNKVFFISLCLSLFLASCIKVEPSPSLDVIGSTGIELSADGGSETITFKANRDWSVSWSDSWISISPSSGTASGEPVTITASCGTNITYEERNATATIKMGELSQTINVRQLANLGIVLPSESFDLLSESRNIEIEVLANVPYSATTTADWIQQIGTKALSSKTLVFSVKENTTYDPREGKITIKPQDSNVQEKVVIVRQAQKNALNVNRTSFDMPYGGGEFEIGVEANVGFDVTANDEWIHYIKTKDLKSSTIVLTVDENPTYDSRKGTVTVSQQNGSITHTISVNQAGRIAVSSIELDETSLTLNVGEEKTLVATILPENATDKTVTWASSEPSVASVDDTGKIVALDKGTTVIAAKAGEKTASCTVTVKKETPVSSIELDANTLSLVAGDQVTLKATVKPDDATDKTVTWSSANSQVAVIDNDGKVTAISKGNTVITATSGGKTARCRVYVKAKHYDVPSGGVDLGLSVIWGDKNLGASSASSVGGYYLWGDPSGTGTIMFYNTPNLNSISGTQYDIATSKKGSGWRLPTRAEIEELFSACSRTFTAINNTGGTRLTGPNGNSIYIPLSGMGFPADGSIGRYSITSRDKGYIMTGESYKDGSDRFAYVYYFEGVSYNWVSYNAPMALFPVRPVYEKLTDEIPVTSVSLNKTSLSLKVGESEALSITIRPSNATDRTVIWTTSDSAVATVDDNGNVTAKKVGSATITAYAGGRQASCKVEVSEAIIAVTEVILNKTTLPLNVGESETLIATVKPDNATDKTVTWSSDDTSIAAVDANGRVTAIKEGTASVYAETGNHSASCEVVVSSSMLDENIIITDLAFKQYLVNNYDWNSDGQISYQEASIITIIDCYGLGIQSLEGIQYFTALKELQCSNNQLTSLDVSKNTALTQLWCYDNQLTSLDVSNNTALTDLLCSHNQLTSLDVSNNTVLTRLGCEMNQLTSLNVSCNTVLTYLNCRDNQLTSLDVSHDTALSSLMCYNNQLTSLDVSNNTALTDLSCSDNQLTSLDVSNNTALKELACNGNQLTSLDVSKNTALTNLNCSDNQLTSLDVSKNTALKILFCDRTRLTSLDVSKNPDLTNLYLRNGQLTSLDVSNNTALDRLYCYNNQLTSLDVSNNTALDRLYCYNNQLTSLDVSNNTALTKLWCYSNQLTSLDVSNNTYLKELDCSNNLLTILDVSNNRVLDRLKCTNNPYLTEIWIDIWHPNIRHLEYDNNVASLMQKPE